MGSWGARANIYILPLGKRPECPVPTCNTDSLTIASGITPLLRQGRPLGLMIEKTVHWTKVPGATAKPNFGYRGPCTVSPCPRGACIDECYFCHIRIYTRRTGQSTAQHFQRTPRSAIRRACGSNRLRRPSERVYEGADVSLASFQDVRCHIVHVHALPALSDWRRRGVKSGAEFQGNSRTKLLDQRPNSALARSDAHTSTVGVDGVHSLPSLSRLRYRCRVVLLHPAPRPRYNAHYPAEFD